VSAALRVRSLAKSYGHRWNIGQHALSDVSLDVHAGELVAIVGPNGAGKTTLLSIIAGVQRQSAGSVELAGSGGVGWAPQAPALYSRLSVAQNLDLFARLERVADPHASVQRMLRQTGLSDRASERVGRLSGGNRQRVNIAVALIGQPPVLALDEPSASLDPVQRERLWDFVEQLARAGTAVVFSTHDVAEAQRHATRLIVLADGRVLLDGPPGALLAQGGQEPGGDVERALVRFLAERLG
jgi:ABC-2 type transport system ATP-binding protein